MTEGFPTDLWNCAHIAKAIRARFGVQYHTDHVGRSIACPGLERAKVHAAYPGA